MRLAWVLLLVAGASATGRRPGRESWVWGVKASADGVYAGRLREAQPPTAPPPSREEHGRGLGSEEWKVLEAASGLLSAVCCPAGATFNLLQKTCEEPGLRDRGLITSLPPNCPPPSVYEPATKMCREPCEDGHQWDADDGRCREVWG